MIRKNGYFYEQKEDRFEIYLPAGDGYMKFNLLHIVKPYVDGGLYQNANLWRLYQLYLFERKDDDFKPVYDFPIVNIGEWEWAVKIKDTPDFHGGFHGYEGLVDTSFSAEEDFFLFEQNSKIYLQGTKDEEIAHHYKKYIFSKDGLTLSQKVVWTKAMPIERSFMTMLPIRRKEGDFSITDTAIYKGKSYDISEAEHSTPISFFETGGKLDDEITILGSSSGVSATVSVDFDNTFFVANPDRYNKLYVCNARNTHTKVGEEWKSNTTYSFSFKKP